MTRDEVLQHLRTARAEFDTRVEAISLASLEAVPAGFRHAPKDVIAHVNAYERLVVERLKAARQGEQTALDRDRDGWEAFNARVWLDAAELGPETVRAESARVFAELLGEVSQLADDELNSVAGVTAWIDPAWLDGHALWELIGVDCFEHYPMHFDVLEAAASEAAAAQEGGAGAGEPS